MEWIDDVSSEQIGDDVTANVKLAQRKKSPEQEDLTIKVNLNNVFLDSKYKIHDSGV